MGGDRARGPLVLRGGALGDFVLTLPLLEAIARRHGALPRLAAASRHMELAAACGLAIPAFRLDDPRLAPLWAGGGLSGPQELIGGVREIYVLRPVEVLAITRRLGRLGVERIRVLDPRPPGDGSRHACDHLARALPGDAGPRVPRLDLPRSALESGARHLSEAASPGPRGTAVLLPGAGAEVKRWPLGSFVSLAERLRREGLAVAWSTGPVERDRRTVADGPRPLVRDSGPLEAASILAAADVVVGNDTGTTHLAAAAGTPVVALFGPTHDGTWRPRGPDVRVLRAPGYGPRCTGCPRPCPLTHPAPCMAAIPVAEVATAALAAAGAAGENARDTRLPV